MKREEQSQLITKPDHNPFHSKRWIRIGAICIAVLVTVLILAFSHRIEELQALGYTGAFLIMLISNATVVFPAPGLIIVFAMSSSLNPWALGLAAGTGAALGELTGYLAGYGGVTPMEHTNLYRRFERGMRNYGPIIIFGLSVIPNPFFDIAGVIAGASHMKLWQFLLSASAGKIIQTTALAWAGALSLEWVGGLFA